MSQTALGLFLLLAGFSVRAQPGPLMRTEHNWTFQAGGQTYGLIEWLLLGDEKYGGGRYTTFYFGTRQWTLRTRTARVVEVALPLGVAGLFLLVLRSPRKEQTDNQAKCRQPS